MLTSVVTIVLAALVAIGVVAAGCVGISRAIRKGIMSRMLGLSLGGVLVLGVVVVGLALYSLRADSVSCDFLHHILAQSCTA